MEDKKYMAPFDMFLGEVKKGDIFEKDPFNKYSYITRKKSNFFNGLYSQVVEEKHSVPIEIVEKYFKKVV